MYIYIHVENNREQYCYGYDVLVQDNKLGNYIFSDISFKSIEIRFD